MKNIEQVDLSEYSFYHLTEEVDPFILEFFSSEGYLEVLEYDLIETSAGILIGYKTDPNGIHNHSYLSNGTRKYFQTASFPFFKDIINQDPQNGVSFFQFFNSKQIPKKEVYENYNLTSPLNDGSTFQRCDYENFGAAAFYPAQVPYTITKIRNVLDITGVGHVLFINTSDVETFNPPLRGINVNAKTFTGMIKNLWEWSMIAKDPFNSTEEPAVQASLMMDELSLDDTLLQGILNNQVDMRVSRFLGGETSFPYEFDENDYNPSSFKDFLKKRIRYKTILSIKENHPNGHLIDSSLLEKELSSVRSRIYQHMLNAGIYDMTDSSIEEEMLKLQFSEIRKSDIRTIYEDYKDLI